MQDEFAYLQNNKIVVYQEGQDCSGDEEEFNPEGVVVVIIGRLKLDIHQVQGGVGSRQEDELHERVVG